MKHVLDIIKYRAYAGLKAETQKAYLGFMWWFIEPIIYMSVFYVVFSHVFERGGVGFVPFLLVGLVAWKWTDSIVRQSTISIQANINLIQQVYIPKFIFPSIVILTNTIKFFIIIFILLCFLVVTDAGVLDVIYLLPVVLLLHLFFNIAVSWFVASIVPFMPDLKIIIDNSMTLLFFMSGIFFEINKMPIQVQEYLKFNPILLIIDAYRDVLIEGRGIETGDFVYVLSMGIIMLLLSIYILKRFDRTYSKLLAP